jgi:hypothetical protein
VDVYSDSYVFAGADLTVIEMKPQFSVMELSKIDSVRIDGLHGQQLRGLAVHLADERPDINPMRFPSAMRI